MVHRKTAVYALLALYEVAHAHRAGDDSLGVRASEIAHKHRLPRAYVAKIMSQLSHAGVLRSGRGPRGGFRLNRPIKDISLLDVLSSVDAMTPSTDISDLVGGLPSHIQASVNRAWVNATGKFTDILSGICLAEVMGF
jgi:Rrf2 family iron-sulfur cluster assembly transcriptional regulator